MKIKLDKVEGGFRADFIELSGSPKVGTGKTSEEAIATLFIRNMCNMEKLDLNYLEINNKPYEDYIKFDR
jgi:hypothetical protein